MIRIETSDECGHKYASPQPVIHVTHSFNNSQLEDLIRVAVLTLGEDRVRALTGMQRPDNTLQTTGPFMVSVQGGQAPRVEHPSYKKAFAEATRLAKGTGARVRVLQVVSAIQAKQPEPEIVVTEYRG